MRAHRIIGVHEGAQQRQVALALVVCVAVILCAGLWSTPAGPAQHPQGLQCGTAADDTTVAPQLELDTASLASSQRHPFHGDLPVLPSQLLLVLGGVIALKRGEDEQAVPLRLQPVEVTCEAPELEGQRVSSWVQIAIEGTWKGHPAGTFSFTRKVFEEIVANFGAKLTNTVVDYEHASRLLGNEAPAAGWIIELAVRDVDGKAALFAHVEWNARAARYILAREYRFLSPTVIWNSKDPKTGKRRGAYLHSLAMTNTPFLEELPEIRLTMAVGDQEEKVMDENLKKIAAKLGLPETATADQVVKAVIDLAEKVEPLEEKVGALTKHVEGLHERLELSASATIEEALAKVVALKNPAGMVPAQRVEALETKLREQDRDQLVEQAQREGKITASDDAVKWAKAYALKDPEGFKAYLNHTPVVVPMNQVKHAEGARTAGADADLTEADVRQCKRDGVVTEEQLKKYNQPPYV